MIKRLVTSAALIGATIFAMVLSTGDAFAEKRVALIIGNSLYQSVPQLPNPSKDAGAVAQMFRNAHFDTVDLQLDLGIIEFKRAIRKFEEAADQADIAVIYYAGHGLEISGINFLIPVDARLANDRDAEDEAVPLDRVLSSAGGAKKLRLVVLDACRDNPFSAGMKRNRKSASRGITTLGGVDLGSTTDTLTAYAAKLGSTAEDGDGDHSPFTTALLKNLTVPGLDVRLAFGRVKKEVMTVTGGKQEPYVYGSLGDDNYALVPAPVVAPEPQAAEMKADFELISSINTRKAWEVYLTRYKAGPYVDRARQQLASLSDQIPQQAVPPQGNISTAAVGPNVIAPGREPSSKEALDWDKLKDSTDQAALQKFISRYPNSPLAITAQQRIDVLIQAAQDREAAKAAQKRDEDERRAKATEAAQKAKATEAERKAAEAKQKADEAEKTKEAAEAAALRAASEKQAREAEAERRKAELVSGQEAACQQEQAKLDALTAKGSQGSGVADLRAFAGTVTCARLGPVLVATLDKFVAEAAKRNPAGPNSLELIRSAQTELTRLGCFTGKVDGNLSTTKIALGRYLSIRGQASGSIDVTESVVADLTKQTGRVCPLECNAGETAKGGTCIASDKPAAPAIASRRKKDDEDRKPAPRQAEREQPRPSRPAAQQQAVARPSGGGGGHAAMVGVGF